MRMMKEEQHSYEARTQSQAPVATTYLSVVLDGSSNVIFRKSLVPKPSMRRAKGEAGNRGVSEALPRSPPLSGTTHLFFSSALALRSSSTLTSSTIFVCLEDDARVREGNVDQCIIAKL